MSNVVEQRFRKGMKVWKVEVQGFGATQNDLAIECDTGRMELPAVDFTDGAALESLKGANKVKWPDLTVTYLQNNQTKEAQTKATKVGKGADGGKFRGNVSVISYGTDGKTELMRINYLDCQIVDYDQSAYTSREHGKAKTEKLTFRPLTIEVVG